MKFRKKFPVEAFCFGKDERPDWFNKAIKDEIISIYSLDEDYCKIKTLEGTMTCTEGDYIVQGIDGELSPCKGSIFERTYEEIIE